MSHDNEDPDRLGGYDAITAVASDLLLRIQAHPQLGRIWRIVEKMASSVKSSSSSISSAQAVAGRCTIAAGTWCWSTGHAHQ
jgi:hypothetical protein